jgi:hypothetical protein
MEKAEVPVKEIVSQFDFLFSERARKENLIFKTFIELERFHLFTDFI